MNLESIRREYADRPLTSKDMVPHPIVQFERWMQDAVNAHVVEPNAMILGTADAKGAPSVRTLLLKGFDDRGFVFYTNYNSAKAREIEENPQVALLFLWLALERQIKIKGTASRISKEESLLYFRKRPLKTQLAAWASPQSEIIVSRKELEKRVEEIKQQFAQEPEIPMPPFWGGYRVKPEFFEFWQGRPDRLHDRFIYQKEAGDKWDIHRLAP